MGKQASERVENDPGKSGPSGCSTPSGVPQRLDPAPAGDVDFVERARDLATRAQKLRRKGELRRAAVALREACALDEENAARWAALGAVLLRIGKREEAARALKQAVYLRERGGERPKATALRRVLLKLAGAPRG